MIDLPRRTIIYFSKIKLCARFNSRNIHFNAEQDHISTRQLNRKMNEKKFTVAVEGNIGSGKTSVLQHFMKHPTAMVLPEPVASWRNVGGHNLLNLMYSDPLKWSFTFQSFVQLTMAQQHLQKHHYGKNVKLMERSIFSARYCFVENLYQSNRLLEPDYMVLARWFEFLIHDGGLHLDLIVYLRTLPETVYQRIKIRGREEEKVVTLEYLQTLHNLHEDWLLNHKFEIPCPILVLDANCDLNELESLVQRHSDEILFSSSEDLLPCDAAIYH